VAGDETGRTYMWRLVDAVRDDPAGLEWLWHAFAKTLAPGVAADEVRAVRDEPGDLLRKHGRHPPPR
jgi:hypothetical protein